VLVTASWLFLIVSIWGALFTLTAFLPPRRPSLLMVIGFFSSWLTTELAAIHLAIQIAATLVFAYFGAFTAWPGWLGLAITLVSWTWLTVAIRQARATHHVFATALHDTIGVDLPAEVRQRNRLWLPFYFRRTGVERIRNVQYVDDGSRRHRLDIYRPSDTTSGTRAPVLFQIHGGAWIVSNKNEQALPLLYQMAARGWVCVSINYGLSPRATWPEHLVDCKRALAWVRAHIAEYGGDPDYVVATGGSAGGHLTAMMALTANDPQWQPGFENVDTSVRAMVPFYGVYDWTRMVDARDRNLRKLLERSVVKQRFDDARPIYEAASPTLLVRADAPPALVVHGTLDTLVPVEEAREFVDRLRPVSASPVVYAELKGAHHAFDIFNSIRALHAIAGVDAFLTWLLSVDPQRDERSRSVAAPTRDAAEDARANDPIPTARTEP
jgi:acetyl esterase/lipase